jgi:Fe2+ or Zn2+ uptake regulation protein
MDRTALLGQSEQLERHIALVEEDLTRQRDVVADLLRDNQDATPAMALLRQFEDLYTRLIADRAIVRRKLDYVTR